MTYVNRYGQPCSQFRSKDFLQHTYKIEGMRQDYLEKGIEKICATSMFGDVIVEEDEEDDEPLEYMNPTFKLPNQARKDIQLYTPVNVQSSPDFEDIELKRSKYCESNDF
jgi:hypothetical protein